MDKERFRNSIPVTASVSGIRCEYLSHDEFNSSPIYEGAKVGEFILLQEGRSGYRPHVVAELAPYKIVSIRYGNKVQIRYKRLDNE